MLLLSAIQHESLSNHAHGIRTYSNGDPSVLSKTMPELSETNSSFPRLILASFLANPTFCHLITAPRKGKCFAPRCVKPLIRVSEHDLRLAGSYTFSPLANSATRCGRTSNLWVTWISLRGIYRFVCSLFAKFRCCEIWRKSSKVTRRRIFDRL